ncbi:MAG: hypothetical protein ALAOOOJD_04169 [bacterium]|nr:hypothetical protein [bacterium]
MRELGFTKNFFIGDHLGGKRFVHFNELNFFKREAGKLQGFRRGERRAKPHAGGIEAGKGVTPNIAQRRIAQLFGFGRGHEQHRRGAVRDLAGVAGRDRTEVTIKNWFEFGQRFERLIFANAVVFVNDGVVFGRGKDGHNFFAQLAQVGGLRGALMAEQGKRILLFAAEVKFFGQHFRGFAHVEIANRVG